MTWSDIEVFVRYDAGVDSDDDDVEPDALGNFTVILEVPELRLSRASTRCTTAAERNCPTGAMTRESRGSSKQGDPSGTGGDS